MAAARDKAGRRFKEVFEGAVRGLGRVTMFILRFSSFLSHPLQNTT